MDFVSSTKLVNDEVSRWNVDCKGDEVGSPIVSKSSERACGRICGVVAARGGVGRKVNGRQTKMREEEVGCCSVLRHSPISCSIRAKYLPPSIWRRCPRLEL